MTAFLQDAEPIKELAGRISGGRTLLIDDSHEFDALIALCRESRDLGIGQVYDWLPRFQDWLQWFQNGDSPRRNSEFEWDEVMWKHPDNLRTAEALEVCLKWMREIWRQTPETEHLRLLVSVCASGELTYAGQTPVLFLTEGSINALLTPFVGGGLFSLKLGAFAVGIGVRSMFLPTVQAEILVAQLRDAAREKAVFPDLPNLNEVGPGAFQGKQGLIVLLHGLFSTDVATFDGFIKAWQQPPEWDRNGVYDLGARWRSNRQLPPYHSAPNERDLQEAFQKVVDRDYLIAGWPHDTFARIEKNAQDLAKLLVHLDPRVPIVFVCHSRGGLLARKAVQFLHGRQAADWNDRVKLCVTFGTPHEGADLAEHPLKGVAAYLIAVSGTGTPTSLARVLAVYGRRKEFEGIEDLRPDSEFLRELAGTEFFMAPRASARPLKIRPVGGIYKGPKPFPQNFVSALLRTREHDLVVRHSSSVPRTFDDGETTSCSHGEYFNEAETRKEHFRRVIQAVRDALAVEEAMLARAESNPLRW